MVENSSHLKIAFISHQALVSCKNSDPGTEADNQRLFWSCRSRCFLSKREGQNCKSHFGSFTAWGYYSVSLPHSLPSGLHLGSRFWGSPPSLLQPTVCIPTQCVNGGGEPLAKQPWGLLPSKDSPSDPCPAGFLFNWPTLWGAIEIKWPLAGWLCNTRHSWPY